LWTALAILALGEHYLVDLVVAFPYALAFQAGWTVTVPLRTPERLQPILAGAALTIGWLIVRRFGMAVFQISPVLSAVLMGGTVIFSVLMEMRLSNCAWRRASGAGAG